MTVVVLKSMFLNWMHFISYWNQQPCTENNFKFENYFQRNEKLAANFTLKNFARFFKS